MRDKKQKRMGRGKAGRRRKRDEATNKNKVERMLRNSSLKTGKEMKTNGPCSASASKTRKARMAEKRKPEAGG